MASPYFDNPTAMPQSPSAHADTIPMASTESTAESITQSTTDSGESFISQVRGNTTPISSNHLAQLPDQAEARFPITAFQNAPGFNSTPRGYEWVPLADRTVTLVPRTEVKQALPPPNRLVLVPQTPVMTLEQKNLLQMLSEYRNKAHNQTNHQHRLSGDAPEFKPLQFQPAKPHEDGIMETASMTQSYGQNIAPVSFARASVPPLQLHTSAGDSYDNSYDNAGGYHGYDNMRRNVTQVSHPSDRHLYRGDLPEDSHSWREELRRSVQNNFAQKHSRNFNVNNQIRQSFQREASKEEVFPPDLSNLRVSADNQQKSFVHHGMGYTNQLGMLGTLDADTNGRRAVEKNLSKATFGPGLEGAGFGDLYGMAYDKPCRPMADAKTVSATTPAKFGRQKGMHRSRKGQTMVDLNGSPIRRTQPHTMDSVHGHPPGFYSKYSPAVVSSSTVSPVESPVSEAQDKRAFSHDCAPRLEEPHTAPKSIFSSDQLVTPTEQPGVISQLPQTTPSTNQKNISKMAPPRISTWTMTPVQPIPSISRHLSIIAPGGQKPSLDVAFDSQNLPFVELLRRARPANSNGVVRLSNIPYTTTQSEISAFLGRNADLVSEKLVPIHIIMDRVSGKTLEAYVELKSVEQAVRVVNRQIEVHRDGKKGGRLGNRFVSVQVCGLEQLMKALFPKAMNVVWHDAMPEIKTADPNNRYSSGFKGFLNPEELVMLVKHVQDPNRIYFSDKCPQRPFECLMSTIAKYPWYMPNYVTVGERDDLFYASLAIVKALLSRMSENDLQLNSRLLNKLTRVIFDCPGFTEAQKDDICFTLNLNPYTLVPPLAPMADHWYVFKTIGPKPGVERDVLMYYIALIREATTSMDLVTLAERNDMSGPGQPPFFGNINIQYPPNVKNWTLAQVAPIEWNVIDNLLRRSLSRG